MPAKNHGSYIYHFGIEICSDVYNYYDSRQATLRISLSRGPFFEDPETVSAFFHSESRSKFSNLVITELFYSPILNINRFSIPYKEFQAYTDYPSN